MKRFFHTVGTMIVLLLAVFLTATGCRGRAAVEDTVQREIEAITAMKQLSLVEYLSARTMSISTGRESV